MQNTFTSSHFSLTMCFKLSMTTSLYLFCFKRCCHFNIVAVKYCVWCVVIRVMFLVCRIQVNKKYYFFCVHGSFKLLVSAGLQRHQYKHTTTAVCGFMTE